MKRKGYSRLSRRLESQSKNNLILSILGIVVVLFLLIKFGIPLLANITGFLSGFQKGDSISNEQNDEFVSVPVLDPLPQATNSSEFIVSGQGISEQDISIFVNNTLSNSKETDKDGVFSFKVFLNPGENKIKVQATQNTNKSDFSDEEIVLYINKPPTLDISSPTDGQRFEKDQNTADIKGTTDSGVRVTVNDFQTVVDENNNFSYTLNLQNGDNNLVIVATNQAGDKTEKSLKVTYSP
ncbi:MAG: hypothetical protein AAB521_01625 [Patescibacteria group bacterium]